MADSLETNALDDLEQGPPATPKKKVPLWGRVFKPFYRLSVKQRVIYSLTVAGAFAWATYVLNSAFGEPEVVSSDGAVLTEAEAQGAAGASITIQGARTSDQPSDTFIEQKTQQERDALAQAEQNKTNFVESVTFAEWEEIEEEPTITETSVPTSRVTNQTTSTRSTRSNTQARTGLTSAFYYEQDGQQVLTKLRERLSSRANETTGSVGSTSWHTRESTNQNNSANDTQDIAVMFDDPQNADNRQHKRGLLPGDSIPCFLELGLDSRISRQVNCNVRTGALKDARFVLDVEQQGDYLFLAANTLVYRGEVGNIDAIAGPGGNIAMSGVADDVNRHTLMRWSALILGGAGEGVWEIVRQPRQTVVSTPTSTTVESGDYEDRDIAIASLSRPASILTQAAIDTFNMPSTVKADQHRLVYVVFGGEFSAAWLPNIKL